MALSFFFAQPQLTRPKILEDGSWVYFGGDFETKMVSEDSEHFTSQQIFRKGSPYTGVGQKSIATPPYHYHLYQTETFDVKDGTLCYLIDNKQGKLQAGESVDIPPFRSHTFWSDPESGKDLTVNITVRGGPNPGFDESFVHNFYGYLSSRTMEGKKPNPFQMLRFLYSADVVLADIPFGLGRFVNFFFGKIIGGWLLGLPEKFKIFED